MAKVTHAPYAIIGDLVIAYGKTTKTACSKRRPTTDLVERGQQTCPDCALMIAEDRARQAETVRIAIEYKLMCGYETTDGNPDDPTTYYCGHPYAHAGDHGKWQM